MAPVDEHEIEKRLPFSEHIRELRTRMLWAMGVVAAAFAVAWGFHEALFDWLMQPYGAAVGRVHPEAPQLLQYRSLVEPFIVYLKTSLMIAIIASMPWVFYQIWLFVAPGLYAREKRVALPFLLASIVCFFGGVAFCRYLVLELAIEVLLKMGGVNTSAAIMMQEYFSFTTVLLLAFGAFFELPVVIAFLSLLKFVTSAQLIKAYRYAVVAAFVIGAIMPSPDIFTQSALAVPLIVLYTVSIGIAWFIERARGTGGAAA